MNAKEVRRAAVANAWEIAKSRDPDRVAELLASPEADVRSYAAGVIARSRLTAAVPALLRRVREEPDPRVRSTITGALAILNGPDSRDTFLELLEDAFEDVRRLALRGLSRLGDPSVLEIAPKFYATGSRVMRLEALDALENIGSPQASAILLGLRSEEPRWLWRRAINRTRRRAGLA